MPKWSARSGLAFYIAQCRCNAAIERRCDRNRIGTILRYQVFGSRRWRGFHIWSTRAALWGSEWLLDSDGWRYRWVVAIDDPFSKTSWRLAISLERRDFSGDNWKRSVFGDRKAVEPSPAVAKAYRLMRAPASSLIGLDDSSRFSVVSGAGKRWLRFLEQRFQFYKWMTLRVTPRSASAAG